MEERKILENLEDRELSWLKFNARVLEQAATPEFPLFERIKFLGIFTSNLDEFVMKRVGGIKRQNLSSTVPLNTAGLSPEVQLREIRQAILPLLKRQSEIFFCEIVPELKQNGIEFVSLNEVDKAENEYLEQYFEKKLFPILTPVAVDAQHPFPFISNLSISLGISLKSSSQSDLQLARIKISNQIPHWILLPNAEEKKYRYVPTIDVIVKYLDRLFPKMEIVGTMLFRLTRNSGFELTTDDEAEDLLELIESELRERKYAQAVRLEYNTISDPWILKCLLEELKLEEGDIYEVEGLLDYLKLRVITDLPLPELKFKPYRAAVPAAFSESEDIFSVLRRQNIIVHHPYDGFEETVERFVSEAAEDPLVRSIKLTVYRVGDETPLLPLLKRAAANGKQVICLVELTARFDEERNIQFAQALADAGVSVVYGVPKLKIHAKTLLVVREEADEMRCYAHIGTGNYHKKTAALYTDIGFFTSDPEYTRDIMLLFNFLTGLSAEAECKRLLVAPFNLEEPLLKLMDFEIEEARAGRPAAIIAKLNALEDPHIIAKLYEASKAGVQIDLIVRGICCLKAGIKGLSENIRVRSIIGRFLEHSRIYYFRHAGKEELDGKIYIASADWMMRNLHKRLELAVPIPSYSEKKQCFEILQTLLQDNVLAWESQNDGSYVRLSSCEPRIASQEEFMHN